MLKGSIKRQNFDMYPLYRIPGKEVFSFIILLQSKITTFQGEKCIFHKVSLVWKRICDKILL